MDLLALALTKLSDQELVALSVCIREAAPHDRAPQAPFYDALLALLQSEHQQRHGQRTPGAVTVELLPATVAALENRALGSLILGIKRVVDEPSLSETIRQFYEALLVILEDEWTMRNTMI
jgi:hypothetical protein